MSDFYSFTDWSSVSPPYSEVIYGAESFFKSEEVKRAKLEFDDYDIRDIDVTELDDPESELRSLFETTSPFFETNYFNIVRNADHLEDGELFSDYCSQISSDILLVLSRDQFNTKKWIQNLNADRVKESSSISGYNISDWIVEYCSDHGHEITDGLAEAIYNNVGDDLYAISNELEKIFIYHEGERRITSKEVQDVLFQHSRMKGFDIAEAWGRQSHDKALNLLTIHYEQSSRDPTLQLVGTFLHHVENLIYIRSAKNAREDNDSIRSYVGKPPFIMKKLYDQVRNWELSQLKRAYTYLCDADVKAKRGTPRRLLLENFVVSSFTDSQKE